MIRPEWSDLSDQLYQWTLLAYFLAFLGFALEYAYGTRGAIAAAAGSAVPRRAAREEALVGASTGWSGGIGAEVAPPVEEAVTPPRWPAIAGRIAMVLTVLGWGLHAGSVAARTRASGHVPWATMYEFSMAVSFVAISVFLVLAATKQLRYLGVWILAPVVVYLLIAGTVLHSDAKALAPILSKSYWLVVHVSAALTATGALMVAGVISVLHLLRRRYDERAAVGPAPDRGFAALAARLAPAKTLDRLEYRLVAFAFPIWTFAVIAGAVWAESAWGRYWGWDPKETWSFITWLVYAAYLHARTTAGWRKYASTVALVAFACLMANYFLINLVLQGLHAYDGV